MDGITILNTIYSEYDFTSIICGAILALFGVIACVITVGTLIINTTCRPDCFSELAFTILMILTTAFFAFAGVYYGIVEGLKEETKYEVTIDESVSMTEFTSKYEIVEQRDSIYVIKDKED